MDKTYWIKFKLEIYVEKKTKKQIFFLLLLNEYIKGIPVFLFIVNEPIGKHQGAGMFVNQIAFQSPNMNAYSEKHANCNQSKSDNDRMSLHQEREKKTTEKTLLKKKLKWLLKTEKEHYSL